MPASAANAAVLHEELARYDWHRLHTFVGDGAVLPGAIESLVFAASEEEARAAESGIDNVALVQGRLSESAGPVAACLSVGLPMATGKAREYILDLLATIAGGYDDHVDIGSVGPVSVLGCIGHISRGFDIYVDELRERGNPSCVDILLMCGIYDKSLADRVSGVLSDALGWKSCIQIRGLIETSLDDLHASEGD